MWTNKPSPRRWNLKCDQKDEKELPGDHLGHKCSRHKPQLRDPKMEMNLMSATVVGVCLLRGQVE